MFDLNVLQFWIHVIFALCGIVFNILLLFLIRNYTREGMRRYRRILYQNCIIEMIFAFANGIVQIKIETMSSTSIMSFGGLHATSQLMSNLMAAVFILTFHLLVMCVPVQYFYRYLIIVRKTEVSNARYLGMLALPITVTILFSLFFYLSINVMPACNDGILMHLDGSGSFQKHYVPCINFDLSRIEAKLLAICAITMVTTVAVVIIWSSTAVYRHLSEKAAMSSNESSLQRQITVTLVIQVSVIALSGLVPANCIIINALLGTDYGWMSLLSSCILTLPPVLNPLFTIFTVKSYRSTVRSTIQNGILPTASRSFKGSNVVIPSMTK